MLEKSYLDRICEMEAEIFQKNRAQYPHHIILLEDCESIYRIFFKLIDLRYATKDEAYLGQPLKVCSDLPNELCLATLSLFRGHIDDSDFHLRKAIELFGYAILMSKSESDTLKWSRAGENDEMYKEFKTAFSTKKIFPKNDQGMNILYEQYDRSSKRIHSSIFSVQGHIVENKISGGKEVHGGIFTNASSLEFKQQAIGILLSHCIILMLLRNNFEKFLDKGIDSDFQNRILILRERMVPLNQELNEAFAV